MVVPGGPEAIVPFRPYIILYTKWDGTLHGSPPASALYRGPRSKRGGQTDTQKIPRAVNFHVTDGVLLPLLLPLSYYYYDV